MGEDVDRRVDVRCFGRRVRRLAYAVDERPIAGLDGLAHVGRQPCGLTPQRVACADTSELLRIAQVVALAVRPHAPRVQHQESRPAAAAHLATTASTLRQNSASSSLNRHVGKPNAAPRAWMSPPTVSELLVVCAIPLFSTTTSSGARHTDARFIASYTRPWPSVPSPMMAVTSPGFRAACAREQGRRRYPSSPPARRCCESDGRPDAGCHPSRRIRPPRVP